MAKSQRASSRKRNNAAIRSRLYGPASDARTERLSAKLQALASKPRPDEERAMDVDDMPEALKETEKPEDSAEVDNKEDMEVDAQGAKMKPVKKSTTSSKKSTRVSKHRITKSKKPRNNIIFPDLQARKQRQAEAKAKRKRR